MSETIAGSFRDPAGFVFIRNGVLFRQINSVYRADYDALMSSGLFQNLVQKRFLVSHEEINEEPYHAGSYKIIRPYRIEAVSYPYEWSFGQLKDAALLTLDIQHLALANNLSLKDASAYNVQFDHGRPIFIDTLSFERYRDGQPWVAYRQFCQHFLAPLALMAKTDIRLNQLLISNIDGIPLALTSSLLPWRSKLSFGLGVHVHLHARSQTKHSDKGIQRGSLAGKFAKKAFLALLDNLKSTIGKLNWSPQDTEWRDYYEQNNNYVNTSLSVKEAIVEKFMRRCPSNMTWDFGANTGRFSQIAARYSKIVCAWDVDPACVEINYQLLKQQHHKNVLPLLLNLVNPSPAIGWNNCERMSLTQRGPVDMILALGLVHHLAISNNVPLDKIFEFLHALTRHVIIEFVPKTDSQIVKLLRSREDIFPDYDQEYFERAASPYFTIVDSEQIPDSQRTLYLLMTRAPGVLQT